MNVFSWTDAHCHLQDPRFGNDREDMFRRSETFGVRRFVVNGTRPGDWERVAELAERIEGVLPQFGVHPWEAGDLPDDWEEKLKGMLLRFSSAGIGEIGLDKKLTEAPLERQEDVFRRQLRLAGQLDRPCSIHLIGAWAELHGALKDASPPRFLLHAFNGSPEQVETFAKKGNAWFSFGGAVLRQTNSDKLREAVRAVPEDRLLLETDAPFQHPDGKKQRQEPAGLLRIAEAVAEIRGTPVDALRRRTESNLEHWIGA